jgi:hypothetical protein
LPGELPELAAASDRFVDKEGSLFPVFFVVSKRGTALSPHDRLSPVDRRGQVAISRPRSRENSGAPGHAAGTL